MSDVANVSKQLVPLAMDIVAPGTGMIARGAVGVAEGAANGDGAQAALGAASAAVPTGAEPLKEAAGRAFSMLNSAGNAAQGLSAVLALSDKEDAQKLSQWGAAINGGLSTLKELENILGLGATAIG